MVRLCDFLGGILDSNTLLQADASKDSSLKRHTALIKRIRQSLGVDNRDQILKDIESLSLEKYIDEIAGATLEGIGRCKTERDVWAAVEVSIKISTDHTLPYS
jgi:regulator of nonsense transcripts 2